MLTKNGHLVTKRKRVLGVFLIFCVLLCTGLANNVGMHFLWEVLGPKRIW